MKVQSWLLAKGIWGELDPLPEPIACKVTACDGGQMSRDAGEEKRGPQGIVLSLNRLSSPSFEAQLKIHLF